MTEPWNFCLDCESPLVPYDYRDGYTGGMCSNQKCNETIEMTPAQREAGNLTVETRPC